MLSFLFFVSGLVSGSVLVFFWLYKQQNQLTKIKIEKGHTEKERELLLSENQIYKQKERDWIKESSSLEKDNEQLKRELDSQKKVHEEKIHEKEQSFLEKLNVQQNHYRKLEEQAQRLTEKTKADFKNIANKIFLESTKSYREESTKNLSQILNPFREDIENFKKSIQTFENKEKFLDETLKDFKNINTQMRDDAKELTQALQGDVRTQGQWGEFVLSNILEKSGLREGEEFIIQGQGMEIKDEAGNFVRPDVIVKLPDNKHIIIDSKVSFTYYKDHSSSNTKEQKKETLKKILSSIRIHIDNLSSKKYPFSDNLQAPDFTLMFIPNEGVFALVTQARDLFEQAWKKSIVLVSPTTLYATLRTVASIWKIEKQNKNAEKIAKQGGELYDKFVGFLEDMGNIDNSLKRARHSYDEAMGKLNNSRGNLIQKAQKLKTLEGKQQKKKQSVASTQKTRQLKSNEKKQEKNEKPDKLLQKVQHLKELGVKNKKEIPAVFEME